MSLQLAKFTCSSILGRSGKQAFRFFSIGAAQQGAAADDLIRLMALPNGENAMIRTKVPKVVCGDGVLLLPFYIKFRITFECFSTSGKPRYFIFALPKL